MYPSAFSDPETGCVTQQICQNRSMSAREKTQKENKLQATIFAPAKFKNKTWDPLSGEDTDILEFSPYAKDEDGNPLFACKCDSEVGDQYYTRLADDPYNCHLSPCFGYFGNKEEGMNGDGKCECGTNTALSPDGKWKNTCVSITDSCGHFSYDKDSSKCTCAYPSWESPCKSQLVNVGREDLKDCSSPINALGTECRNPCESKGCEHKTTCESISAWEAKCDCATASPAAPAPWQYIGPTCGSRCVKNGTTIKTKDLDKAQWFFRCITCCSEDPHRTHNVF